jgi:Ca-activated chloride channel family protein
MTFEHPGWLLWLVLLVPLAMLEWRALVRADRSVKLLLGTRPLPGLLAQRMPERRLRALVLRLAAAALLTVGAAGPQWGREAVRRQSQGSDIAMVIDVSASMQTRDVPPSRMEEARREAVALLERLQGSRVGVVAFAGDAIRLCPLTLDQAAVRLSLETIGPGTVSDPGTDLGRALRTGLKLLPAGRRDEQAMVVWTDGEDLEGHAREAIEDLRRSGLRVFVVGVGTPAGDVIPMLDVSGVTVDVKRDERGAVVRSRLDEGVLNELARATRGGYFAASRSGGELVRLASSLGSLARSRRGTRLVERPVSRFPLCALLAAAGLVAFLGSPRRRIVKRSAPMLQARGPAAAAVVLVLLVCPRAAQAQSDWARGDAAFKKGDWVRAESLYARRARGGRAPADLLANLATARAHQAPGDSAVEQQLSHLSAREDAAGRMSGYNLGTLLGKRGEIDRALGELRRAIERDPDDADARWNYELLRRQKEQAEKKSQPKPDTQQRGSPDQPKQPQQPQSGQGQPQPQQPPQPNGSQSQSPQSQAPPPPGMQQPMTRDQAERLLGSLGDLERLEQQNKRRSRVQREKRGKDW